MGTGSYYDPIKLIIVDSFFNRHFFWQICAFLEQQFRTTEQGPITRDENECRRTNQDLAPTQRNQACVKSVKLRVGGVGFRKSLATQGTHTRGKRWVPIYLDLNFEPPIYSDLLTLLSEEKGLKMVTHYWNGCFGLARATHDPGPGHCRTKVHY